MITLPTHIAIIMDGNRRWARKRGLPDIAGHRAGANNLEKLIPDCAKLGIKTLTVYALSTENIEERATREIKALFNLLIKSFTQKSQKLAKNGVRVDVLGNIERLPEEIQKITTQIRNLYIKNEAIKINVALNYGGRAEIISAVKKLFKDGVDMSRITESEIDKRLYTLGQEPPQLVIRTGGMIRLSNFLLWQTAYSELYFSKKLWPDFQKADLVRAIKWYQKIKRNFGK